MTNNLNLIMCCLGNGITVCNRSVMENGDYQIIAHISNSGNIKLYIETVHISFDNMGKIIAMAKKQEDEYHKYFESLPPYVQYNKILNAIPFDKYICKYDIEFIDILPEMREYYYTII